MSYIPTLWFLLACLASTAVAHEIPDGRAEVGIDVIVDDDVITIRYELAMNDKSMAKQHPELAGIKLADGEDLVRHYGPLALPKIAENLVVEMDGVKLNARPVSWEPGSRHPVRLICHYEIDLTEVARKSTEVELKIHDRNFTDFEKQFTTALRTHGKIDLISTTAANLLVRADRNRLWLLDEDELADLEQISAKIRFPHDSSINASEVNTVETREQKTPFALTLAILATVLLLIVAVAIKYRNRGPT